jgi:predicted O-methyltransferase YrrM
MAALKSILNLLRIGILLLLEAPIRPRWAYYRLRGYLYNYIFNRFHKTRIGEYAARIRPLQQAVAGVTGRSPEEVAAASQSELIEGMEIEGNWVVGLKDSAKEDASRTGRGSGGPIEVFYGPSPELMKVVNLVCRLARPEVVIETGVAKGFTTASILEALDRNGSGYLYSVEMPSLYFGYRQQVGEMIPESLRKRWSLELGPSAVVLPRLLKRLGSVDVFVYDSASSYDNQKTELSIVLKGMPAGGILISDLLINDAFIEAAESTRCEWVAVQQTKAYPIGILRRLP